MLKMQLAGIFIVAASLEDYIRVIQYYIAQVHLQEAAQLFRTILSLC